MKRGEINSTEEIRKIEEEMRTQQKIQQGPQFNLTYYCPR